jgi:glycosyltransferase involved in cell wall biosynthesis
MSRSERGRVMLVSSNRKPGYEEPDAAAFFARHPYSTAAILHHLERLGWATCRLGAASSFRPRRLARRIDAWRPDIVYTYGCLTALQPLAARRLFCRHRGFKVVHGWDDVYGDIWRDVYGRLPGRLMDLWERAIVTRSDAVVTLSRFNQMRGRRWGVECRFIPNGADVPVYDPAACSIRLEGRLKLVYTGDQARWKRTWEVCAAMRHLPADIKLYLTGEHYPYLDKYASENCIFLGYLPRNDQLCVMAQADVLVVTADQDCNAKLQEYLRFNKPILGYDGRANLFFTNGRNALLTRDYVAAIGRLADDPGLRRELAENAARFDAFFLELTGGKGAAPAC